MSNKRFGPVKTLLFVLSFIKPHRVKYFVGAVLGAFEILMTLLLPTMYQKITLLAQGGDQANTMRALISIIALLLFVTPFVCLGSYIQRSIAAYGKSQLRKRVFAHSQRQSLSQLQNEKIGNQLTLLLSDVDKAIGCLTNFSNVCLFRFVVLFGYSAITSFLYDWRIALLALISGIASLVLSIGLSPKTRAIGRKAQEYSADAASFLLDSLRGLPIIRVFALHPKRMSEYNVMCDRIMKNRVLYRLFVGFVDGSISTIQYVTQPLALLAGIGLAASGSLSIDQAVLCAGMASVMAESFYSLSQFVSFVQNGLVSGRRVQDYLDQPIEASDPQNTCVDITHPIAIEWKHVKFSYPQGKLVFNDANMIIPNGNKTVIIGESGGGKSTLIKLVEALYEIPEGEIFYYGRSMHDLSIQEIRGLCAYVPQECSLFEGTIGYNIALGKKGCVASDVQEAAYNANLCEYIESLPNGYDTLIGERGLQLSGGQRQRIAIARAFIRNAPILLLDEATASLDAHSEDAVLRALDKLMIGKTVIQLAHRQNVIEHSDQVLLLKDGQLLRYSE